MRTLWFVLALLWPAASWSQAAREPATVTLDEGGLAIEAADGGYALEIGGRIHVDGSRHSGLDAPAVAADGTELRRARIELGGQVAEHFGFSMQYDFSDDSVKDVWVSYEGWKDITLTIGHQKQPYGLSLEMSSNDLPFIERSIDNALLSPFVDRALGARVDVARARWFAAAGVFGDSANDGDESWGTVARFVYAPFVSDDRVLHLGLRAAYREPHDTNSTVRIRDRSTPYSDFIVTDTTPLTGTESITLAGPEVAYAQGPFSVTSEYNRARVERASQTHEFDSWHVAATWSPGGASRAAAYSLRSSEFKRLEPARGFRPGSGGGTWELAARIASLDLNDGPVVGGTQRTASVGANWYANGNLRVLLDWTRILDTDRSSFARVAAQDMDIVRARLQLTF